MARVTVEDCVERVPNRFDLVMFASQRARDIGAGAPLTLERDNDKNPVVALREIADQTLSLEALEQALIRGRQKVVDSEESEEDLIELMEGESDWVTSTTPSKSTSEAADDGESDYGEADAVDEEVEAAEAALRQLGEEPDVDAGDAEPSVDDVSGEGDDDDTPA